MDPQKIGFALKFLLISVAMSAVFFMSDYVISSKEFDLTPLFLFLGFAIILAMMVTFISRFLDTNKSSSSFIEKKSVGDSDVYGGDLILNSNTNDSKSVNEIIDGKKIEEITKLISDKLELISAETYFKDLKNKIKMDTIVESFVHESKGIELRVKSEINRLSKSAIINLSLGMMLSIGGILYLGSFVINAQTFDSLEKMFINTFPKAIFVLLIEVFAYFFLKLYKQNLEDIKYYQNELTNIESKNLAVQISKQSNNHKLLTLCVEEFLSTERNFILEKDQSTIEIEKERINSNNTNSTLQVLKDIFKNKV
ncbi:hypothetical protein [Acinetobacter pittii]|uniref:hypothetical protein n=1 Tax=Acinetobacter pittii TaxID=48296 RepID=UPI00249F6F95|nr:hypothetical protein [Acinetobacter pittii]WHA55214.1 hypothetical protein OH685_18320 [Acinetobacter pittii]